MLTLFHQPFSPFCRKIRLIIAEKNLAVSLEIEKPWARRPEFLALNPAGEVPVLIDDDGTVIADSGAIAAYLEERYPEPPLCEADPVKRAEMRRLVAWFDLKLDREVTRNLAYEKLLKSSAGRGGPDSERMRAGRANIGYHLDYIGYLAERRRWLAGDRLSLADLTAAAHLSVLDYAGEVPWSRHADAKDWYARLKSRPSFRSLLAERMVGIPPAACYSDLDF